MAANPNPFRITTELWWAWEQSQKAIPGVRYGGTYTRKRYYHSSVNENLANWAPNYSIKVWLDLNGGNKDKGRAIDLTMSDAEMRKRTRLLRDSALNPNDDRLFGMREFYGTLDGRTVFGLIKDDADGPWRSASSDTSHLWHIHAAFLAAMIANAKALAGFISVISGESLASWRARMGGTAPAAGLVPEPTLRENDTGPRVGHLQRALNEALGLKLAVDEDFGPSTTGGVKLLQRRARITEDGIYGPNAEDALRGLLEDDMPTAKEVALEVWRYKNPALTSLDAYAYLRDTAAVLTELKAGRLREEAILAAVKGLNTQSVIAAVNAAAAADAQRDAALLAEAAETIRAALDPAVLVAEIAEGLDHELDIEAAERAVETALRKVFGELDGAAGAGA